MACNACFFQLLIWVAWMLHIPAIVNTILDHREQLILSALGEGSFYPKCSRSVNSDVDFRMDSPFNSIR